MRISICITSSIWRKKVAQGDVIVVRYADDLVVGFENRMDAERFLEQFRERLAKFGLELHADKTRLIEFGRNAARNRKQRGEGKPETFTFLGFTHYSGKRRSNGSFSSPRMMLVRKAALSGSEQASRFSISTLRARSKL